jgi:hypothetical protein
MKDGEMYEARLLEASVFSSYPCTVCGGRIKAEVLCEAVQCVSGKFIRVCPRCLEAGDIDRKLKKHAAKLQERAADLIEKAAWLKGLVGRVTTPSFADWKAAEEETQALTAALAEQQLKGGRS